MLNWPNIFTDYVMLSSAIVSVRVLIGRLIVRGRRALGVVVVVLDVGGPGGRLEAVHRAAVVVVVEEMDRGHAVGWGGRAAGERRVRLRMPAVLRVLLRVVVPFLQRRRDLVVEDGWFHG